MRRAAFTPALIAHGGAGARAIPTDRAGRRRGLLNAVGLGARILNDGGSSLDAVIATVMALEDDPLFNAGYGSVLTSTGRVEMDAGVMFAGQDDSDASSNLPVATNRSAIGQPRGGRRSLRIRAGGVVTVSRVRNPILLARAVMEHTPHLLMGGAGAEAIARSAGIKLCRRDEMISTRARDRWLARSEARATTAPGKAGCHGTVGAAAIDRRGSLASATSTGGVAGKLPGRIGDSAIFGAGLFAAPGGAASATGTGEAIMQTGLCREAVGLLARSEPSIAAARAIAALQETTEGEAGIIIADRHGRIGYAHNAAAMDLALFDGTGAVSFVAAQPLPAPTHHVRRN
ncbi:MAG: isoaspartyl peptidase/L-asparaginase [Candidatus Binataceae bacterium]